MKFRISWKILLLFSLIQIFITNPNYAQMGICEIELNDGNILKADVHDIFVSGFHVQIIEAKRPLEIRVSSIEVSLREKSGEKQFIPISIRTIKQLKTTNTDLVNQISEKYLDTKVENVGENYTLNFSEIKSIESSYQASQLFDSFYLFLLYRINESQSIGVNLNYYPKQFKDYFINTSFYSGIFSGRKEFQSTIFNIGFGYNFLFHFAQLSVLLNYSIQHGFAGSSTIFHQDDQYRLFMGTDAQIFGISDKLSAKVGLEYYPVQSEIIGQKGNVFVKIGIGYKFY